MKALYRISCLWRLRSSSFSWKIEVLFNISAAMESWCFCPLQCSTSAEVRNNTMRNRDGNTHLYFLARLPGFVTLFIFDTFTYEWRLFDTPRRTLRVPINAFVLFHNVSSHELQISCTCTKFITKKHTQKQRNNTKFYLFYRNLRSNLKLSADHSLHRSFSTNWAWK